MKIRMYVLLLLVLIWGGSLAGQEKKPLDHSVFEKWNDIGAYRISPDGNWLAWVVAPARGDGTLYVRNLKNGEVREFARGEQPQFLPDSRTLLFRVSPPFDSLRQARLDKKKPEEMPKDTLGIYMLESGTLEKVERVKSFRVPEEGAPWFAYHLEKPAPVKDTLKIGEEMEEEEKSRIKKEKEAIRKKNEAIKKAKGSDLVVVNTSNGKEYVFNDITNYQISKKGDLFVFLEEKGDSVNQTRLLTLETGSGKLTGMFSGEGELKKMAVDEDGKQVAFLFSADTGDVKIFDLYYGPVKDEEARMVIGREHGSMQENWCVSEHGSLWFSRSGERLFFGTAPVPEPEPEDTLLPEEKYEMDLWAWTDGMLQPMQKARLDRLKNRNYLAVYHIPKKRMVQLADENMQRVNVSMRGDGDVALGLDDTPYLKYISWDAGGYVDMYRVDVNTGGRKKIFTMTRNRYSFSPGGKYLAWFSSADSIWYAMDMEKETRVNLTGSLNAVFWDPLHDTPSPTPPNGVVGWTKNDEYIVLYDDTDIWKLDPAGKEEPLNLTAGYGARNGIRYRYLNLDRDKDYLPSSGEAPVSLFHLRDKSSGYALIRMNQAQKPQELLTGDFRFYGEQKAKNAEKLVYRRSSFGEYPDLWVSDLRFRKPEKVSHANPQQDEYLWGTAELVEWTSMSGELLQGILYKPENFDPEKKYPLMVYFYERYSDALHRHIPPRPGHNINFTQYVSDGYLVFLPDVSYKTGYPGESAYNAVVSGTTYLIDRYPFVDRDHVGVQGHSWGAYQIAWIITRTDLFKAAEAGAPVSNMTSAYGGIRWESGMVRQFQYEETQSRIGGTLWEKPWHYIENSPLFFVPRIKTPLLILHNDKDGAVPWYQGIELFTAMRRLGKPVWLLNYNGEPHHLTTWGNRMDYTIRMKQFFDHYLKDAPAPEWMVKGIPATEKGINDGYRLMEE